VHADLPRFWVRASTLLTTRAGSSCPHASASASPGFVITIALPEPCLALYPSVTWASSARSSKLRRVRTSAFRRLVRSVREHRRSRVRRARPPRRSGRVATVRRNRTRRRIGGFLTRVEIWRRRRYPAHAAPEGEVRGSSRTSGCCDVVLLLESRLGSAGACAGVFGDPADGIYVDATSVRAVTRVRCWSGSRDGRVIALTRILRRAERAGARFLPLIFASANFAGGGVLDELGVAQVDGCSSIWECLRCSSMRRTAFFVSKDGPLDMRMNPHAGKSAYEVLATASERELATVSSNTAKSARRDASPARSSTPLHRPRCRRHDGFWRSSSPARCNRPGQSRTHPCGHARVSGASHRRQRRTRRLRDGLDSAVGRCGARGRVVAHSFHFSRRSHRETEIPRRFPLNVSHEEAVTPDGASARRTRAREALKMRAAERKADDGSARASRATPSSHRQPAQCEVCRAAARRSQRPGPLRGIAQVTFTLAIVVGHAARIRDADVEPDGTHLRRQSRARPARSASGRDGAARRQARSPQLGSSPGFPSRQNSA